MRSAIGAAMTIVALLVLAGGLVVMYRRLRDVKDVLAEMPGSLPPAIAAADEFEPIGSGHSAERIAEAAGLGVFPCDRCGGSGRLRRSGKEYECSTCERTGWTTHGQPVGMHAAWTLGFRGWPACDCCQTPWAWVESMSVWPAWPPGMSGTWTRPDGSSFGYGGGGLGNVCKPCWAVLSPADRLAFLRVLWRSNRMQVEIHKLLDNDYIGGHGYPEVSIAHADAEWPWIMRAVLFGETREFGRYG